MSMWEKNSWLDYPAMQQPQWPNQELYDNVISQLSTLPALVFAGETRALKKQLAKVAEGNAFVLQCGDCSENFCRCSGPCIHALIKVILQMSIVLAYAGEKQVVNIARLAGQYAKPRSSDMEQVGDLVLPSYRGDMVNSFEPDIASRTPDPGRMLEGYFRATATLNLVRAFTRGGYAALDMLDDWHKDFAKRIPLKQKYEDLLSGIRKALRFVTAMGLDVDAPQLKQMSLYTSHEGLLLGYEQAMTRIDTTTGRWYDTSAHFLWIGDRTRQLDGAHVHFMSGICNPIGMKIGPNHDLDEIKRIIERINPDNTPGRMTLITRFGADKIETHLPGLLQGIKEEGFNIVWICDPMHGNTYKNDYSLKSRRFDDVLQEIRKFFLIHKAEGTIPGGIHLELTGDDVTECTGGRRNLADSELCHNYQSTCDPRLNAEQAVELAFEVAEFVSSSG
jgi:3-deoxy-7-phosphoheptulonate synthase